MNNVTNLNRFKKSKARQDKMARAKENAVKHGRTKAQKSLDTAKMDKMARDLDGKSRT